MPISYRPHVSCQSRNREFFFFFFLAAAIRIGQAHSDRLSSLARAAASIRSISSLGCRPICTWGLICLTALGGRPIRFFAMCCLAWDDVLHAFYRLAFPRQSRNLTYQLTRVLTTAPSAQPCTQCTGGISLSHGLGSGTVSPPAARYQPGWSIRRRHHHSHHRPTPGE